jgi:hypothetical protein
MSQEQLDALLAANENTRLEVAELVGLLRATNSLLAVAIALLVLLACLKFAQVVRK